jgi:hypothetical protein
MKNGSGRILYNNRNYLKSKVESNKKKFNKKEERQMKNKLKHLGYGESRILFLVEIQKGTPNRKLCRSESIDELRNSDQ